MAYLLLGAAALWFIVSISRGKTVLKRREWRFVSGAGALVAFTGAAYAAVRGAWEPAIVLVVVGLWLALSTRTTGAAPGPPRSAGRMSLDEARSILGVSAEASSDDIQAAYTRLMRMAHPDKGGTSGLAAQLNAARDRLLGRR
jgi:hypothetical protein